MLDASWAIALAAYFAVILFTTLSLVGLAMYANRK